MGMSVLLFVGLLGLTLLLHEWLQQHIQLLGFLVTGNIGCAVQFLFYLLLPGVFLHELSHFLVATALLVPVTRFDLGVRRARGARINLGSVNIVRTDRLRESLIGAAPFFFGIVTIWLIVYKGFGFTGYTNFPLDAMLASVRDRAREWTTWLYLYLIFAVSTAMIPSESDRAPWGPVLVGIVCGVGALLALGWAPHVSPPMTMLFKQIFNALTFTLGIVVAVNGMVAIALAILEQLAVGVGAGR
jgi:hypothetical protein